MARNKKADLSGAIEGSGTGAALPSVNAESLAIAQRGIQSSEDFRNLMCAMMGDVIQGRVTPEVVNAACNAGRGLLKMVEIEYRATAASAVQKPTLPLSRRIGSVASA